VQTPPTFSTLNKLLLLLPLLLPGSIWAALSSQVYYQTRGPTAVTSRGCDTSKTSGALLTRREKRDIQFLLDILTRDFFSERVFGPRLALYTQHVLFVHSSNSFLLRQQLRPLSVTDEQVTEGAMGPQSKLWWLRSHSATQGVSAQAGAPHPGTEGTQALWRGCDAISTVSKIM